MNRSPEYSIVLASKDKVILECRCGRSKKCPELTIEGGMLVIRDDYGGSVKMPVEQGMLLTPAIEELTKNA